MVTNNLASKAHPVYLGGSREFFSFHFLEDELTELLRYLANKNEYPG